MAQITFFGVQFERRRTRWSDALRYVDLHCCSKHAWGGQPTNWNPEDVSFLEPKEASENSVQRVDLVAGSLHIWDWKRQRWVMRRKDWYDEAWVGFKRRWM